jgi:sulfatase maturation enzyme AslB (radical SAM superfamily)
MTDKKILCIGNETEQSDYIVTTIATAEHSINHGLISSPDFVPIVAGYYHTSLADIPAGAIAQQLAKKFDQIIMLDQDVDQYPHFKSFVNTFRLMIELEKSQFDTKFRDNACNKSIIYWYDLLRTNKSMCVYPFIGLQNDFGGATLCQKNPIEVAKLESIVDWQTAPGFTSIRNNMLDGIQMFDNCHRCYEREESNGESARQFESLEWAIRLKLTELEDLKKITHPVYIEVRPNNKCNIMCRMCDDRYSDLIEKENKKFGFPIYSDTPQLQGTVPYDKINFDTLQRIHWTGGEATVQPEFYAFLRKCIKEKHVDFDLTIGTNGKKISDTLLGLLSEFPMVTFSVSFDGYEKVNDYIRWGTNFDALRENCYRILQGGHNLAFQTVFSMYNATRIHEVYQFYDREFPAQNSLVQPAGNFNSYLGPWHNPLKQQVLESMYRCRETKVYYNGGRNTNNLVDEVISRHEQHDYNPAILKQFFQYNDNLDRARKSNLIDYIPELDQARKYC